MQLYNCVYQYISFHFLNHSKETNQDPVNAASFGKLIRSVFLGLRTRRIGTRGNSKYHYYGIRVKPTSSLNQFDNEGSPSQGIFNSIRLVWHLPTLNINDDVMSWFNVSYLQRVCSRIATWSWIDRFFLAEETWK